MTHPQLFQPPGSTHPENSEVWYRVTTRFATSADEWDNVSVNGPYFYVEKLRVLRHTPKGVWLAGNIFVRGKAVRQYAVPTLKLAILDEIARRDREISANYARARRAQQRRWLCEKELAKLLKEEMTQ